MSRLHERNDAATPPPSLPLLFSRSRDTCVRQAHLEAGLPIRSPLPYHRSAEMAGALDGHGQRRDEPVHTLVDRPVSFFPTLAEVGGGDGTRKKRILDIRAYPQEEKDTHTPMPPHHPANRSSRKPPTKPLISWLREREREREQEGRPSGKPGQHPRPDRSRSPTRAHASPSGLHPGPSPSPQP